jgi:putative serine/threonine protein kinase
MKPPVTVPINELYAEPYASVVCYPRASLNEMQSRIEELKALRVEALEFGGRASAFALPVLGKGYVGVVVAAYVCGEKFALKMQRVDSERESLEREAELLVLANSVNVGPKFVAVGKRFLLMQLVDGDFLEDWLETNKDKDVVRKALASILEQCWRMDKISLDHGELSKAPKHLIMDKDGEPFIVDFETASTQRHASNVTSVCQFLFQGNSNVCKIIAEVLGQKDDTMLRSTLKVYKKERNRRNFEAILEVCVS